MIQTLSCAEAIERMNRYGRQREPFLFAVDFEMQQPLVLRLSDIPAGELLYDINGRSNAYGLQPFPIEEVLFEKHPISREQYGRAFQLVQRHQAAGDTYLLNLAFPTPVATNLGLKDVFLRSRAPYRLWWKEHFSCFSPECFITIREGQIASYPMKGTIDASIPEAHALLLGNEKKKRSTPLSSTSSATT